MSNFVSSMFSIIQTLKKCSRSCNAQFGTKTLKQAEELKALRALHSTVAFKDQTTKKWFIGMYAVITDFYAEQLRMVTFDALRSWTVEQKQQHRLDHLVLLFKNGIYEELPGGCMFLLSFIFYPCI